MVKVRYSCFFGRFKGAMVAILFAIFQADLFFEIGQGSPIDERDKDFPK